MASSRTLIQEHVELESLPHSAPSHGVAGRGRCAEGPAAEGGTVRFAESDRKVCGQGCRELPRRRLLVRSLCVSVACVLTVYIVGSHYVASQGPGSLEFDVIIVGAGAAGIAAAKTLKDRKCFCLLDCAACAPRYVVLEARPASYGVGGRAHTVEDPETKDMIDMGAQWLHGAEDHEWGPSGFLESRATSARHPFVALAKEAHLDTFTAHRLAHRETDPNHSKGPVAGAAAFFVAADHHVERSRVPASGAAEKVEEFVEAHVQGAGAGTGDMSWAGVLRSGLGWAERGGWTTEDAVTRVAGVGADAESRAWTNREIWREFGDWWGARIDEWSAKYGNAEDGDLVGADESVHGGLGGLLRRLFAAGGHPARFGHVVTKVEHGAAGVEVHCAVGPERAVRVYHARSAIITIPAAVLRYGLADGAEDEARIEFAPPLPEAKRRALDVLGTAVYEKVVVTWPERWWPGDVWLAHEASSSIRQPWPFFMSLRAAPHSLVTCLNGVFAEEVGARSDAAVEREVLDLLAKVYNRSSIPSPISFRKTHWKDDPFARGSWSIYNVGSSPATAAELRKPLLDEDSVVRVAFAGEHTADGSLHGLEMSTVHGAWLSGVLAAKSVP